MSIASDRADLLGRMGTIPDDVAATLRTANVQGIRHTVRFLNPIIRYAQVGLRLDSLDPDMMTGVSVRLRHGGNSHEVPCPAVVQDFLHAFNTGTYPDLELPESVLTAGTSEQARRPLQ